MVPEMQTRVSVQPVEATDDAFWDQFWADTSTTVQDVFALVPAAEIRAVREESPSNLATLCYKVHCSARSVGAPCCQMEESVSQRPFPSLPFLSASSTFHLKQQK